MAGFVQTLLAGNDKTAGTSIAITGSKTITVGNTIFLAFASDDLGSAYSVSDNLGNSYSQVKEQINTGNAKAQLWIATITVGGTLTTQTVSWTTNVTATAAASSEFSRVGPLRLTDGANSATNVCNMIATNTFQPGELWVGAAAIEDDAAPVIGGSVGTPTQTVSSGGTSNTTGGGSATNMAVGLAYVLINAVSTANANLVATTGAGGNEDSAGAGAIYHQAVPFKPSVNFQNPAVFMERWRPPQRRWWQRPSGLIAPMPGLT